MQSDEEFVKQNYPTAFAWFDEDGTAFVSLPALGESSADEFDGDNDAAMLVAWSDAARRIRERAGGEKCS